jgi:glycine cleavage system aminomethyltransferase T
VGELGWELHIPNEDCVAVYRALMEAGRPHGLVNAGYRAIDSLSIEKGYPHWHQELRFKRDMFFKAFFQVNMCKRYGFQHVFNFSLKSENYHEK